MSANETLSDTSSLLRTFDLDLDYGHVSQHVRMPAHPIHSKIFNMIADFCATFLSALMMLPLGGATSDGSVPASSAGKKTIRVMT